MNRGVGTIVVLLVTQAVGLCTMRLQADPLVAPPAPPRAHSHPLIMNNGTSSTAAHSQFTTTGKELAVVAGHVSVGQKKSMIAELTNLPAATVQVATGGTLTPATCYIRGVARVQLNNPHMVSYDTNTMMMFEPSSVPPNSLEVDFLGGSNCVYLVDFSVEVYNAAPSGTSHFTINTRSSTQTISVAGSGEKDFTIAIVSEKPGEFSKTYAQISSPDATWLFGHCQISSVPTGQ